MLRSLALAALLAGLAPQGCEFLDLFNEDFLYEEAEYHLLPSGDQDALLYVEVYSALSASGTSSVPALEALLRHRRVYPPGGGFLHIDLDEPFEEDDFDRSDPRELQLAALLEQLPACVEVEAAGLFLDARGELCAWRATRIRPLGKLLAAVDALVCLEVQEQPDREAQGGPEAAYSFPWLDAESVELARQRALAGGPWVRLVAGRLALDWPISPAGAARALEQVVGREDDPPLAPWFCSQVASLTFGEGRVLALLGSAEGPAIHFQPPAEERREGPDAELIEAVRAAGLPLAGPDALDRVLAGLHEE